MRSKIFAIFVVALFFGCTARTRPAPPSHAQYVIGCYILDESFTPIRGFPGKFCLFLDDGSFVSVQEPSLLTRVGPRGDVLWERKIAVHHQLKLSNDGKSILTLSSVVKDGPLGKTRYDVFTVLDLANGNILKEWSSYEHRKELFGLKKPLKFTVVPKELRAMLDFEGEYTHFNSIQEIPKNTSPLPAFAAGNYLVGMNGMGLFAILDHELKHVIWTEPARSSPVQFHDLQAMEDGTVLVYNNNTGNPDPKAKSGALSLERIDPATGEVKWRYPKAGKKAMTVLLSGGVQWLGDTVLFNANSPTQGGMAYLIDLKGNELWSFPNPTKGPDGIPTVYQDVKRYDLSAFLKANRL